MKILSTKILLTIGSIIMLFILIALAQEMNRRLQVQREVVKLESEVAALEKNLIEMKNLNQYFKTDDFAELMAREKLNYKAEGEKVVLIPEQKNKSQEAKKEQEKETKPIPQKWWDAFFNKQ